jgi:hypothetical protein
MVAEREGRRAGRGKWPETSKAGLEATRRAPSRSREAAGHAAVDCCPTHE